MAYIKELGVRDVYFPGHIGFDEVLAYYHLADVFLCASEHEGFCVPLVEAMYFDVPIIAYDSTAIGGTLNGSGILMKDKDPMFMAAMMNRLMENQGLREQVIHNQQIRLKDFDREKIKAQFIDYLKGYLEAR